MSTFQRCMVGGAITVGLLAGCATRHAVDLHGEPGGTALMNKILEQKNKLVHLPLTNANHARPILLLLHGATSDPTEMLEIARQWDGQYEVYLFSFDHHAPIERVGSDLVRELKALKTESGVGRNMTVVVYSYSAIVFRSAVIMANEPALFRGVSLIQLVPTAGGSCWARFMRYPVVDWLVSLASEPSRAENPYGRLAEKLWDGEGNHKFYEAIDPGHMHSILLEGDSHSLSGIPNRTIQERYKNGVGPNCVIIPKSSGVTHDYFPTSRVALEYLRRLLEAPGQAASNEASFAGP